MLDTPPMRPFRTLDDTVEFLNLIPGTQPSTLETQDILAFLRAL